jgi:hypothetical protein
MSNVLWRQILDLVQQRDWPCEKSVSEGSQRHYEAGLDLVNSYRGHPEPLVDGWVARVIPLTRGATG